jgi:5-(carboxyamino)imidazole ribonucleotide synthase
LVEFLFSPARITEDQEARAQQLARRVIEELQMVGLLAVEMFLDRSGEILVNEIAPRPHNSGHQTIEGNITSQYQQLLRAILNWPLGSTAINCPTAMVNLLGEPGFQGPAVYEGLEEVLALAGAHIHLYGKKITKPFRKMGHVTITDTKQHNLEEKARFVKNHLKIKS